MAILYDKQSNGRRTTVESKSNRSCNQRIMLQTLVTGQMCSKGRWERRRCRDGLCWEAIPTRSGFFRIQGVFLVAYTERTVCS